MKIPVSRSFNDAATNQVASNELLRNNEATLDDMDLWLRMQAYHFFCTHEEAIVLESERKGYNGRFEYKAPAYRQSIKNLIKFGLLEGTVTNYKVLSAPEFIKRKLQEQAKAEAQQTEMAI